MLLPRYFKKHLLPKLINKITILHTNRQPSKNQYEVFYKFKSDNSLYTQHIYKIYISSNSKTLTFCVNPIEFTFETDIFSDSE